VHHLKLVLYQLCMEDQNYTRESIEQLLYEKKERLKELGAINETTNVLKSDKPVKEKLQQICNILPLAWQYPEHTVARIKFSGSVYVSKNFKETPWFQKKNFETIDETEGYIEIFYLKEFVTIDEGPFMKEERHLINNLSIIISGYLNTILGKEILKKNKKQETKNTENFDDTLDSSSKNKQLLHKFLVKHNSDRDIYHDLMPFKVREILLVANLYDAYIIEKEGRFFEQLSGEYHQLNLSSAPRITGVSTPDEALERLQFQHFDLVIVMMGIDKATPLELSKIVKQIYPNIPILLLLNNNSDIGVFEDGSKKLSYIDKVFVWNGDSKIFLAMVKYIEDKINVENDTKIGFVRVILLIEDSAKYYSRYLPLI
jgi:CheY-like chemotaxis protein